MIGFCSCKWPRDPAKPHPCHRTDVAKLLIAAATRPGVPLRIVEWPGGPAGSVRLDVDAAEIKATAGSRLSIHLPEDADAVKFGAIGWASTLTLCSGDLSAEHIVGPARVSRARWVLDILQHQDNGSRLTPAEVATFRSKYGLEPRVAGQPA